MKNRVFVCKVCGSGRIEVTEFCKYSSLSLTSSNRFCSHQLKRTSSSGKVYSVQEKTQKRIQAENSVAFFETPDLGFAGKKRQRDFIVRTKFCNFLKTESVGRTSRISSKPAYMLLRIHPLTLEYSARNKCSGMLRENKSCRWLLQVLAMSARPFPLLDLGSMQRYEVFGRFRKSEQKIS